MEKINELVFSIKASHFYFKRYLNATRILISFGYARTTAIFATRVPLNAGPRRGGTGAR
jgi:hypothetical protein